MEEMPWSTLSAVLENWIQFRPGLDRCASAQKFDSGMAGGLLVESSGSSTDVISSSICMGSLVRGSCRCGFIGLERRRDGSVVAVCLCFVTFVMIKIFGVLESKGSIFVSVRDVKSCRVQWSQGAGLRPSGDRLY